jgi:hypothetical protein
MVSTETRPITGLEDMIDPRQPEGALAEFSAPSTAATWR